MVVVDDDTTTCKTTTTATAKIVDDSSRSFLIATETGIDVDLGMSNSSRSTTGSSVPAADATSLTGSSIKPCPAGTPTILTTAAPQQQQQTGKTEQEQENKEEEYYVSSYPMIGSSRTTTRRRKTNSDRSNGNQSSMNSHSCHSGRIDRSQKSNNTNSNSNNTNSNNNSSGGVVSSITSTLRSVLQMSGSQGEGEQGLTPSQKLFVDPRVMKRSIYVLRLAILSDAINMSLLSPNYPFMVTPGAYPDSFPSTAPFDYSSAVTFLMMMAKLGAAVASLGIGSLSDKVGRKPCLVFCLFASCFGQMLKYFCRFDYWYFCGACFVNGLVSATMPVATAYIGDVVSTREQVQQQMTIIYGLFLLGMGGGGIIATIMTPTGLFTPLWVGVALNAVASVVTVFYLIEPNKSLVPTTTKTTPTPSTTTSTTTITPPSAAAAGTVANVDVDDNDNESDIEMSNNGTISSEHNQQNDDKKQQQQQQQQQQKEEGKNQEEQQTQTQQQQNVIQTTLNYKVFLNIVAGALFDTIGSSGLFSLNYTILAKEKYIDTGIVSDVAFKWTSNVIMFAIIPGIIIAPIFFRKIGIAKASVMANILTGLMTLGILYLIKATKSEVYMYWITMAVIFIGFPFTVMSQVSVTPMVQVVAPPHKRGFCQGFASSINQIGGPVSTYLLGLLIQNTTDEIGVWVTIIISFLAAIINLPLTRVEGMGPISRKVDNADDQVFDGEDPERIKHIMDGNWVPYEELVRINRNRRLAGQDYLVVPYGSYKDDKDRLSVIQNEARSDVHAQYKATESFFAEFNDSTEEVKNEMCEGYNRSMNEIPTDVIGRQSEELGKWITDYLTSNGYPIHVGSQLYKAMVIQAFPKIGDNESGLTVENCESKILSFMRALDVLSSDVNDEDDKYGYSNLLVARAGVASSRAEDLITKKDN